MSPTKDQTQAKRRDALHKSQVARIKIAGKPARKAKPSRKRKPKAKRQPKPQTPAQALARALREHKRDRTHESYARAVQAHVIAHAAPHLSPEELWELQRMKLGYGVGPDRVRGRTLLSHWTRPEDPKAYAFVGLCASCQESRVQMTGTIVHELAHVLAGQLQKGIPAHGAEWQAACKRLGLHNALAAGTEYTWQSNFVEPLLSKLQALAEPTDGAPMPPAGTDKIRPCTAGHGSMHGQSRGTGSGSRMVLWVCQCEAPAKVRASVGSGLDATCNKCKAPLVPDTDDLPPAHGQGPTGLGATRAAAAAAGVVPQPRTPVYNPRSPKVGMQAPLAVTPTEAPAPGIDVLSQIFGPLPDPDAK